MSQTRTDTRLCYLSATEAVTGFRTGTLRPIEVLEALIARAAEVGAEVNAFTHTFYDQAREQALAAEQRYRDGTARPLEGVALAVKDSTPVAGTVNSWGSKVYEHHVAERTHPGAQRLLDAGAIMIARTTMPEFGEAGNCYTPLYGVTRNPWNLDFGPGGSSGGAGAALAAGLTTVADGSDIGGSIRIPAACCGVYGYKPPAGRNPNPLDATFDPYLVHGPLARTVADMRLLQNVISGVHVEDITSLRETLVLSDEPESIAGWDIAYSLDLGYFQVEKEIQENLLATVDVLRSLGANVTEVDLDWGEDVYDAWLATNATRGSAARMVGDYPRWRDELSDYVRDWLDRGAEMDSGDLVSALDTHVAMYRRMGPILEQHRVFLCPTNCIPSVPADRSPLDLDWAVNGEPVRTRIGEAWFMTYPFNMLAQLPVLNVPIGVATSGVPLGMQVVGPSYDDAAVFALAAALEGRLDLPAWPA